MATSTGKAARKSGGNRAACKGRKTGRKRRRAFGKLPVSASRGNAQAFIAGNSGAVEQPAAARRPVAA